MSTWVQQAPAIIISDNATFGVTTESAVRIDNPYFTYAAPGSTSPVPFFSIPWAQSLADYPDRLSIPAYPPTDVRGFSQEVPANPAAYTQSSTLIGTYSRSSDPSDVGVVLMFDDVKATGVLTGQTPWETLFPAYIESDVVTALQSGDTSTILNFFTDNLSDFPTWSQTGPASWSMHGTLIGFSGPTNFGSAGANSLTPDAVATPEPGTLALLSLGGVGMAFGAWRRRRASSAAGPAGRDGRTRPGRTPGLFCSRLSRKTF